MEDLPHYKKLMDYAIWLLSKRSYTIHNLSKKLSQRIIKLQGSMAESERAHLIQQVLERLIGLNYLDDLRFCEQWVTERTRLKPRGKYMLNHELRRKGISKETLEQFWETETANEVDELSMASKLVEKQLPRTRTRIQNRARLNTRAQHQETQIRQKLYMHLASKGFSPDVIRNALDKALNPS